MPSPIYTQFTRLWAAFMFFTRLPLWRIYSRVPAEAFRHIVAYWPLSGWLTGGIMAITFWLSSQILPIAVALILSLAARLLLTGALHEDGLADFFDGFGGGQTKERILTIMKDSHIGTFGVLGLLFYFGLFYSIILHIPPRILPAYLFCGDLYAKACSSALILFLPYARPANEAKIQTTYIRPQGIRCIKHIAGIILQLLPLFLLIIYKPDYFSFLIIWFTPLLTVAMLIIYLHRRLQGYTGDCCGATFLLTELTFHLTLLAMLQIQGLA